MPADRPRMRPFEGLAPWSAARDAAAELARPLERTETLPLAAAVDRVLAADVLSRVDVPSADRAAMDGYAVQAGSGLDPGARLRRRGRIAAGQPAAGNVEPGSCIEIATGAPLPAGADAVVPVEETERDGEDVLLRSGARAEQHVARRGEDLRSGRPVARAGDPITAALLAACAAGGAAEVEVWARPRVLVAPTGDEVVTLGSELAPGQVYDSNAAGLLALLGRTGAEAEHAGIVLDDDAALQALLARPGHDLVVTIGGTSVGRRDLVSEAAARAGEILVHGVAVRPGKPLLLARVGSTPLFGLPGFPTTCMMLGYALLAPAVRAMGRRPDPLPSTPVPLGEEVRSPAGKAHLLPVTLRDGAAYSTFRVSSAVSSMARAQGWIEIDAETEQLAAGTLVRVHAL